MAETERKTGDDDAQIVASGQRGMDAASEASGRPLSFEEASDAVFAKYDETLRRLADAS